MLEAILINLTVPVAIYLAKPGESKEATVAASRAYLMYSGADKELEEFERRYFSEDLRVISGTVIFISQIASDKYISYAWQF